MSVASLKQLDELNEQQEAHDESINELEQSYIEDKGFEKKVNFFERMRKALLPILNQCVEAKQYDAMSLGEFKELCRFIGEGDDEFHERVK